MTLKILDPDFYQQWSLTFSQIFKPTFLNITKGSSILESTFNVMLGGRPSVKAYLSVITKLPPGVHSPTLSTISI
jgi:hypothetical protein